MSATSPAWPCRHAPPCFNEAQHWEVCGLEYPDDDLNDPVCEDCGWPGGSCSCHEFTDDEENRWPIARDEIVVKQKPGHVVAQVSEETLLALRKQQDDQSLYLVAKLDLAKMVCNLLARDLAELLKERS